MPDYGGNLTWPATRVGGKLNMSIFYWRSACKRRVTSRPNLGCFSPMKLRQCTLIACARKHCNGPDRVDDADVLHVLRVVLDAQHEGPVLMHCKHGRNRTCLMAAKYRVVVQDWRKEDALREMQYGGYGSLEEMADVARYVEKADFAQLRLAMASGKCNTTRFSTCYVRNWLTQF